MTETQKKFRKENTLSAHRMLLQLDDRDFQGNVTFSFKRGEGLKAFKIEEFGNFRPVTASQGSDETKTT